ncbi:DUF4382 domain-containing protein [Paraferrimonas sp. SM1919]|uniref:DUF4382 domain-containing protein n=1 Tax=Paraferrimonas sp. SM1919 TaxID=2662263 RepID=UPI0013CF8643|nr:DUF4382 domain-containing protein [Paraferrimonas sp. SM1919]
MIKKSIALACAFALGACSNEEAQTNSVSFYISDAPVDNAQAVVVNYSGITLSGDEGDVFYPVTDAEGNETTAQINLLDYQNGDSYLLLSNLDIPAGSYKSLIVNTEGCQTHAGASAEFCYVVNDQGQHPLSTPSNKLKLGGIDIAAEGQQEFTIEFNLRKALVERGKGEQYNLKPHGVSVLENRTKAHIEGVVDEALLTANDCDGNSSFVYLYPQNDGAQPLADAFDPAMDDVADVVAPIASAAVVQNAESNEWGYKIANIVGGDYQLAFSCDAASDNPEIYDGLTIPNPEGQVHDVTVQYSTTATVNFEEIIEEVPAS